jgi:hypothetical protein
MRDVYNRKKKLSDGIERVNINLDRLDSVDVLSFAQHMKDNTNVIHWNTRCITALINMRNFMRKSYKDANKENIRTLRYHGEPQEL